MWESMEILGEALRIATFQRLSFGPLRREAKHTVPDLDRIARVRYSRSATRWGAGPVG